MHIHALDMHVLYYQYQEYILDYCLLYTAHCTLYTLTMHGTVM